MAKYDSRVIARVLQYVQHLGDLNPRIIGALSGVRNAEEILGNLRNLYGLNPLARWEALGLDYFYIEMKANPKISLLDLYNVMDGHLVLIARNDRYPERIKSLFYFPTGIEFQSLFEKMVDNYIISEYSIHKMKKIMYYAMDFSELDFVSLRFKKSIVDYPRDPLELPNISDGFKPDWLDLFIIGKKQEINTISLKEIAKLAGVPYRNALYHYQKHVIGKGLVRGNAFRIKDLQNIRVILTFGKNEEVIKDLSKILTLSYAFETSDNKVIANVYCDDYFLGDVLDYISYTMWKHKHNIDVSVHAFLPRFKYLLTASIPYEHYDKHGKWVVNKGLISEKIDSLSKKIELLQF
ncbi:hypothetical protein GWK48_09875 [Metallosphaera tengchongensis]|uniref:Lrp/AsnC family transcriptional regulator n=1 Tax=Metallosphaera tengchongensis TaxID=1532350 RepID=A0A6N0P033_9CREN|nr:hypothetical protein [Metallosphaera tengchongensis]QKR00650.1 hypothetical protein GWK48_09875 [Metallosphaera tengchongensis]